MSSAELSLNECFALFATVDTHASGRVHLPHKHPPKHLGRQHSILTGLLQSANGIQRLREADLLNRFAV